MGKPRKDFLDEMIAAGEKKHPGFGKMVDDSVERRRFARRMAAKREARELSQTLVAARMGTSASVVSKLEAGGDVKISTLQKYFTAIGLKFDLKNV